MKAIFEHLVIFSFSGVNRDAWPGPLQVSVKPEQRCTVRLVPELDAQLTRHADEDCAVRWGMLRGISYMSPGFDELVQQVRDQRPRAAGYAVITIQGPVQLDMSQTHVDMGGAVVGFDLASGARIRDANANMVAGVAAALAAVAYPGRPKRLVDATYYFDASGRVYYSSTAKVGSVTVSASWTEAGLQDFIQLATGAAHNVSLGRALRLLASTFDPDMDGFQRMITLWTGLEVLVNKLYPIYQNRFMGQAATPSVAPESKGRIVESKAKLADKFALLAAYLRPECCEDDARLFHGLMRSRHAMVHSGEFPDQQQYSDAAASLLIHYVAAHIRS